MKRVSIIIPVYNAELTIEKCIKSILQQDYKNLEIIVIDDGSKDKTQNIIEKYLRLDDRIRYIKQSNSGVSAARNRGIKESIGEYIIFVDSDDWLERNMISEMMAAINRERVDVVRCNFSEVHEGKKTNSPAYKDIDNRLINHKDYKTSKLYDHLLTANQPLKNLVMLLCIKKQLLIDNSIYFDEELYMLEDVLFYQNILHYSKSIYFLNKYLYNYRENPNSVTRSPENYEKMIFGVLASNKKINNFLLKNKIVSNDYIRHINGNHFRIIVLYLYYIWNKGGRHELYLSLKKLYKNTAFVKLTKNYDNYHISKMFSMFFISIVNKRQTVLRLLFFFKKIKGVVTCE